MRKRHLAPALMTLVALGVAIAVKLFKSDDFTSLRPTIERCPHSHAPANAPIATMKIVPAQSLVPTLNTLSELAMAAPAPGSGLIITLDNAPWEVFLV